MDCCSPKTGLFLAVKGLGALKLLCKALKRVKVLSYFGSPTLDMSLGLVCHDFWPRLLYMTLVPTAAMRRKY